jgi:NADPH-dependent 2,4-dienoyl-CoA reductase/sulfur reductase-like enzyme/rhodanese-related sulfurtransferase
MIAEPVVDWILFISLHPRSTMSRKVVIIGGVAGGASAAARLRRLDETARIVMVERGPYISFANCGLPYHISGAIADRDDLVVTSAADFEARFDVEVMPLTEAIAIDRTRKVVTMRKVASGESFVESYDQLILSPGAEPLRPPLPGLDSKGVFVLRNIPDLDRLMAHIQEQRPTHATVVGAGFIGIEAAENLIEAGIAVTLVERGPQVLPFLDPEFASLAAQECRAHGMDVRTSASLASVTTTPKGLTVHLEDGAHIETGLVLLAIGVRPESGLAREAGLELTPRGAIRVDEQMRTSDPCIFAVGDAVEVIDRVTGDELPKFLAGPANRQGRLVADVITGRPTTYAGALGTSIIKVFNLAAACTGLSETQAARRGIAFRTAWIHAKDHAGYYPGAHLMTLKAIFEPGTGKLLGAQAIGSHGVDKRIDVLATALSAGMTVYDLEDLDLAYAPPFSSAKDPVNQLATVSAGILRHDHPSIAWHELSDHLAKGALLLDVREPHEYTHGTIKNARSLPLPQLRDHLGELPRDRPIVVMCEQGLRGYLATRILIQYGFEATNLLGGYRLWAMAHCPAALYKPDCPVVDAYALVPRAVFARGGGSHAEFTPPLETPAKEETISR